MTDAQLAAKLQSRFDDVCATEEASELLEGNPLGQDFVLDYGSDEPITVSMTPHSSNIDVEIGAPQQPVEFQTSRIDLTEDVLRDLIAGEFLSTYYLTGEITIEGLQPAWLRLGRLFGINHELLRESN